MTPGTTTRRGFSLVELIVVIMIVGMLAAMAIPRLSRGSRGSAEAAVMADLYILRQAIQMYAAEHEQRFPGMTAARVVGQLTRYTNRFGNISANKTGVYKFGPYLVAIPPCPVGVNAGSSKILIDNVNSPPKVDTAAAAGWVYNPTTGEIIANSGKVDIDGKLTAAVMGG